MAANDGPGEIGLRGALQHQILADEIVQRRQADGGERGDQEHDRQIRRGRRHAAVGRDFERMAALIQIADQHEQRAGRDAVIQHLIHRAVEPLLRERKDSEHHESQVAHRGIRHQLLHVGLHHRDQRSVDDAGDGECRDPGRGLRARRSGNSGRQKRTSPYVPIFSMTDASMMEPAVGASTCASGSQVCSGNSGTLIANATKNARNSSICACAIEAPVARSGSG